MSKNLSAILLAALALLGTAALTNAQTTSFNYTGYLLESGVPANGSNDLRFTLYTTNDAGIALGTTTIPAQPVNDGIFVVTLDFGAVFDGNSRWLEIAARPVGSAGPFTNLFPRQPITAAPHAVYANNGVPPGAITAYMGATAPAGWLMCDGSAVSRSTYAGLYAAIGNSSGSGNGTTTFNLPDLRGRFVRGVDGNANRDPDKGSRTAQASGGNSGNNVGSLQSDATRSHSHTMGVNGTDTSAMVVGGASQRLAHFSGDQFGGGSKKVTDSTGGSETRPINVYVNYIIKY